ncbi:uncharacterized protein SPPG_08360 [Spizellomyces punctatus DAOM BR117]|uniref:Uncharacterized protein n=1 Tax=Spizellomyces punctatus (strain DAOM BR117) TaxID=645134 RepID=A0A0L0H4S8_SPIPD|nr:uncharacterized protein SPPG_08360 [Spizellomyces punctatus DAOM BR117]KNC96207.1 hypothetical protein SPPG_08360 [Spizellomyces punctatus DAOM BR117]|eukprot:XP_016604247.1 hypothetical protein SPPG_08360 [Spizellomyces punctatus DAOM BR117]
MTTILMSPHRGSPLHPIAVPHSTPLRFPIPPHRGSQEEDDAGGYQDDDIRSEEDLAWAAEDQISAEIEGAPLDLRPAFLNAFSQEELASLAEIIKEVGKPASTITYADVRKEFSEPLGRQQILCAATGIAFHTEINRGSFPQDLHRISQKLQREGGKDVLSLIGLTIRVEREIF